jgi:uncharacterized damage-inducible protein DinB
MSKLTIARPAPDEHAPFYKVYVDGVKGEDLFRVYVDQMTALLDLVSRNADRADHAYAEGKWTVKEVVGHIVDGERIFCYRALRFARADTTDLPGFDEDAFVANGEFATRAIEDICREFEAVRRATIALAEGFTAEALMRRGKANGKEISVRALLYIIAGHADHHMGLLRERYGLS